jgi:hypothetical protein
MHLFTCWLNISRRPPKRANGTAAGGLCAPIKDKSSHREREKEKQLFAEGKRVRVDRRRPWEMQKVDRGSDAPCILPLTASIFQEHCSSNTKLFETASEGDVSWTCMIEIQREFGTHI